MPLISIIIPIYKAEREIKRGMESILNQTFKDFEVILINDGSPDKSGDICDLISEEYTNVTVIHKENGGSGSARNVGIDIAKGKFIMFFDIDDLMDPKMLDVMYQNAVKTDADIVICSNKDINITNGQVNIKRINQIEQQEIIGSHNIRKNYIYLFQEGIIQAPWGKLYKSEIIKRNSIYFPHLKRCQDIVFNINLCEYVNHISVINAPLYEYYTPDSQFYLNKFPQDMFEIFKEVNFIIINKLKQWNVYDENIENYFQIKMLNEAFLSVRLCENKNWKMDYSEKKVYIKGIVKDSYIKECLKNQFINLTFIYKLIAILFYTKNVPLIRGASRFIIFIQVHCRSIIDFLK